MPSKKTIPCWSGKWLGCLYCHFIASSRRLQEFLKTSERTLEANSQARCGAVLQCCEGDCLSVINGYVADARGLFPPSRSGVACLRSHCISVQRLTLCDCVSAVHNFVPTFF